AAEQAAPLEVALHALPTRPPERARLGLAPRQPQRGHARARAARRDRGHARQQALAPVVQEPQLVERSVAASGEGHGHVAGRLGSVEHARPGDIALPAVTPYPGWAPRPAPVRGTSATGG